MRELTKDFTEHFVHGRSRAVKVLLSMRHGEEDTFKLGGR